MTGWIRVPDLIGIPKRRLRTLADESDGVLGVKSNLRHHILRHIFSIVAWCAGMKNAVVASGGGGPSE